MNIRVEAKLAAFVSKKSQRKWLKIIALTKNKFKGSVQKAAVDFQMCKMRSHGGENQCGPSPLGPVLTTSLSSAGNRLTSPWNSCNFRSPLELLYNHSSPTFLFAGTHSAHMESAADLFFFLLPSIIRAFNYMKHAALELH